MSLIEKIFGTFSDKELKNIRPSADPVLALEEKYAALSEEELSVYKRGRNAKSQPPKNADPIEYRVATGLEALFGYLYAAGEHERIRQLFEWIWEAKHPLEQ